MCLSDWNTDTKCKFIFPVFFMLEEGRNIGVFLKPRVVSGSCAKKHNFKVFGSRLYSGNSKTCLDRAIKKYKKSKTRVNYSFSEYILVRTQKLSKSDIFSASKWAWKWVADVSFKQMSLHMAN